MFKAFLQYIRVKIPRVHRTLEFVFRLRRRARADRGSDPPEQHKKHRKKDRRSSFRQCRDFDYLVYHFGRHFGAQKCSVNFIVTHFGCLGFPSRPSFGGLEKTPANRRSSKFRQLRKWVVLWILLNCRLADLRDLETPHWCPRARCRIRSACRETVFGFLSRFTTHSTMVN